MRRREFFEFYRAASSAVVARPGGAAASDARAYSEQRNCLSEQRKSFSRTRNLLGANSGQTVKVALANNFVNFLFPVNNETAKLFAETTKVVRANKKPVGG